MTFFDVILYNRISIIRHVSTFTKHILHRRVYSIFYIYFLFLVKYYIINHGRFSYYGYNPIIW